MTIKELEKILINEKIPRKDYEITGDNYLRGYDGYIILPAPKGKWELYYMERGQKDLLGTYPTDHACCIEFFAIYVQELLAAGKISAGRQNSIICKILKALKSRKTE